MKKILLVLLGVFALSSFAFALPVKVSEEKVEGYDVIKTTYYDSADKHEYYHYSDLNTLEDVIEDLSNSDFSVSIYFQPAEAYQKGGYMEAYKFERIWALQNGNVILWVEDNILTYEVVNERGTYMFEAVPINKE